MLKISLVISIAISGVSFLLTLGAVMYESFFGGGNHTFLFDTALYRFIMQHPVLLPLVVSIPLCIPILVERNKITTVLLVVAVLLFVFFKISFRYLSD